MWNWTSLKQNKTMSYKAEMYVLILGEKLSPKIHVHEINTPLQLNFIYTQQKKLGKMCLRDCNTRTVIVHEM